MVDMAILITSILHCNCVA